MSTELASALGPVVDVPVQSDSLLSRMVVALIICAVLMSGFLCARSILALLDYHLGKERTRHIVQLALRG